MIIQLGCTKVDKQLLIVLGFLRLTTRYKLIKNKISCVSTHEHLSHCVRRQFSVVCEFQVMKIFG